MPDQEDIDQQLDRLTTYRHTLATYLNQQAVLGAAHAPPGNAYGIRETREHIRRIKSVLRDWDVAVEDRPDDEATLSSPSAPNKKEAMSTKQGWQILLIEDNKAHAQNIVDRLGSLGYQIETAYTGPDGLTFVKTDPPDLIILDIRLATEEEGFDVLRTLQGDQATRDIPVIVYSVTAKDMENRLRGLSLDAMWCLDKHEGIIQLEATVRRALRFVERQTQPPVARPSQPRAARLRPLDFDPTSGKVWIDAQETHINLSPLLAKLLALLVERAGMICPRDEIAAVIYEKKQVDSQDNQAIDRLVSRLRVLLNDDPANPRFIESIRGFGYRLKCDEDEAQS
jgi:DNA-binding response OmpR family regulator